MGDNMALAAEFERVLRTGDFRQIGELTRQWATDDFVEEWPQSGERLTKDAAVQVGENYPEMSGTSPKFSYKRMLGGGDIYVIEGTIDYGDGVPVSYVGIGEMRDGKIAKVTEYFANPFEAPAWRKPFVQMMEPVKV
ncbi:MAG: nuclear transport factor 2 family protein [Chloroflexi bacterium]|nr:MAG: nuclear transport factor 2 family protein [Chloroflexota bacterium]